MRATDRQKLLVGIVVTALLAAFVYVLLRGQRSGAVEGECMLIAELPAKAGLSSGAPVLLGDEMIGVVDGASLSKDGGAVAVRMFVRPDVFRRVGEDATVEIVRSASGENAVSLNLGTKPSSWKFVKIKAVKGK